MLKNVKELIIIFSLFCLFSIINYYSPAIYNSVQSFIFIPISVFLIYKIAKWLIRYISIRIDLKK